jgi:hypothetical protein
VRYDNRLFQLERQSGRPPARSTVLVYEAIDGQIEIRYRNCVMRWTEVRPPAPAETVIPQTSPVIADRHGPIRLKPRRVCDDHPWRRVVDEYYVAWQLAKDRRAWEAVQP